MASLIRSVCEMHYIDTEGQWHKCNNEHRMVERSFHMCRRCHLQIEEQVARDMKYGSSSERSYPTISKMVEHAKRMKHG